MAEPASRPIRVLIISGAKHPSVNVRLLLEQNGLQVASNRTIADYLSSRHPLPVADVALIHVDKTSGELEGLDTLLDKIQLPSVFTESAVVIGPGSVEWGRKLAAKIASAVGRTIAPRIREVAIESSGVVRPAYARALPMTDDHTVREQANKLWVLGASLGGPDAVRRFLAKLQPTVGVGFVLAQHIGEGFAEVLAEQLGRSTSLHVTCAHSGATVGEGQVVVAPVKMAFDFDDHGRVKLTARDVVSRYTPCIDDVITSASRRYGASCGAIIFSGMGSDGALGCKILAQNGGLVWAQDAASCVISSMPDSARETGVVTATGTPEELAARLLAVS